MVKKVGALPIQLDLNIRGVYNDFLWTGISYRTSDAVVALFGVDYGQSSFGYSYDITVSKLTNRSGGSHEVSLALLFDCKPQRTRFRPIACPKF